MNVMQELGLRSRSSFSWNICFEFSVKPDIINSFISRKILPTAIVVTVLTSIAEYTIVIVFFNAGITQHDFKSER